MKPVFLLSAFVAATLSACSASKPDKTLSCMRTGQEPLSELQALEAGLACGITADSGLVLHFAPSPEAEAGRCAPALIAVVPAGFAAPRIELGLMNSEGRYAGTSIAVRDFLFSDRLTNSAVMDISSVSGCAGLSVSVQDLRCRASASNDSETIGCGPVRFEGTNMFGGFEPAGS